MIFQPFFKRSARILFAICLLIASYPPFTAAGAPGSGLNIALAALGGKVESFTSQKDDGSFSAATLIDGRGAPRPSAGT